MAGEQGFDFTLNQGLGHFVYLAQIGYTDAYYSKDLVTAPGSLPLVRAGSPLQEKPWTISIGAPYDFEIVQHTCNHRATSMCARAPPSDRCSCRSLETISSANSTSRT